MQRETGQKEIFMEIEKCGEKPNSSVKSWILIRASTVQISA